MAKEPAKRASSANPNALRHEIERADRELVKLLNARATLARKLAEALGPEGTQPAAGEIQPVLDWIAEHNKGPLNSTTLRHVYLELLAGARALDRHERVAFLGPEYSYSHLAAIERFGAGIEQVPVASIAAVFEEVNRGHVEYGVVPIENSTDGRVADTLDMFTRLKVHICGEVQLRIHHTLLGLCPRGDVVEVYSKPQALSQCRNWLAKHLPNARTVEVTSTSTAAELARDKHGAAAVASLQAGLHFGLNVLAENIEDNQTNVTRFAVIGHESAPRSGRDQMALMFEIEHKPGGLADALAIFKRNKLNLTWIESFPIARPEGGYMFFVEMDGHETEARVKKAVASLERRAVRLEILGSFPRSLPLA
jgi:chorismate mutase/prephenate dehydratase